jgi:hypothetical protein
MMGITKLIRVTIDEDNWVLKKMKGGKGFRLKFAFSKSETSF